MFCTPPEQKGNTICSINSCSDMNFTCLQCGIDFKRPMSKERAPEVKFCSWDCSHKFHVGPNHSTWAGGKQEAICPICNKKFLRNSYERKNGLHKYCSKSCFNQFQTTKKEIECVHCGKLFYTKKGKVGTRKYCSMKCCKDDLKIRYKGSGNPSYKGSVKFKCIVCGKEKEVYPSYEIFHNAMFCSKPCKGKWMTKNIVGINHPNWLGGPRQYPVGWNEKYKEVIRTRDKRTCKVCGIPENGHKHHVHHIDYERENLDVKNLVTVCLSCHLKTNFNRDVWQNYFENRLGGTHESHRNHTAKSYPVLLRCPGRQDVYRPAGPRRKSGS